jgi:hypothetical protein
MWLACLYSISFPVDPQSSAAGCDLREDDDKVKLHPMYHCTAGRHRTTSRKSHHYCGSLQITPRRQEQNNCACKTTCFSAITPRFPTLIKASTARKAILFRNRYVFYEPSFDGLYQASEHRVRVRSWWQSLPGGFEVHVLPLLALTFDARFQQNKLTEA